MKLADLITNVILVAVTATAVVYTWQWISYADGLREGVVLGKSRGRHEALLAITERSLREYNNCRRADCSREGELYRNTRRLAVDEWRWDGR